MRPVWVSLLALGCFAVHVRRTYYGRIQAALHDRTSPDEHRRIAEHNRRDWGYTRHYRSANPESMKTRLRNELGGNLTRPLFLLPQ